jgi:hypothetical protein
MDVIQKNVKLSFLDQKSMPYLTVDSFFKYGTPKLEIYNEEKRKQFGTTRGVIDFNADIYGEEFVKVFRAFPKTSIGINMMEFLSLKENEWVESNVIEIYFILLNSKEYKLSQMYTTRRKNYFLSPDYLQLLVHARQQEGFSFEKQFPTEVESNNINYFQYHTLFFPCTNNKHWILVEVLTDDMEIIVYDSLVYGGKIPKTKNYEWVVFILATIIEWLHFKRNKNFTEEIKNWNCRMGKCARQKGTIDCGIFMLIAGIFLCEGLHECINEGLYLPIIPLARYKIGIDIYQGFISDFRINKPLQVLSILNFASESINSTNEVLDDIMISKFFCGMTFENPIVIDGAGAQETCSLFVRNNVSCLEYIIEPTTSTSKGRKKAADINETLCRYYNETKRIIKK